MATSVPTHYEVGKRVLEAGKHAFIEKPMTLKAAHAEELVELAEDQGRMIMSGHLLEYHPALRTVKDLLDAGDLGRPTTSTRTGSTSARCAPTRTRCGASGRTTSTCSTTSPARIRWRSAPTASATCRTGVEDVVFGYIRYPSGVVGHMHVSWLDPHKARKVTVVGSEKMVVFDDMESDRKVTIYDKGAYKAQYESYGEYISLRFGDIHIPRIPNDEPLRLECEHFLQCIREGATPISDGHDGLNVVRVLEAMELSLREAGRPVRIDELSA